MTPWWSEAIDEGWVPIPVEQSALPVLAKTTGLKEGHLPAGYWPSLKQDLATLEFADFAVLVRSDMANDVAHLLTWCLVEQRLMFEKPYHHIAAHKSPLTYPLIPDRMADSPIPLHPGAERFYREKGYLK